MHQLQPVTYRILPDHTHALLFLFLLGYQLATMLLLLYFHIQKHMQSQLPFSLVCKLTTADKDLHSETDHLSVPGREADRLLQYQAQLPSLKVPAPEHHIFLQYQYSSVLLHHPTAHHSRVHQTFQSHQLKTVPSHCSHM